MHILMLNIVYTVLVKIFVKIIAKIQVNEPVYKSFFIIILCYYFKYGLKYTIFSTKMCRIKFSTNLYLLYEKIINDFFLN